VNRLDNLILRALRRRDALAGLVIVLFFVVVGGVVASFVPYQNTYNPQDFYAAAPDALPGWVHLLPGYSNLPPNLVFPSSVNLQAFKSPSAVQAWVLTDPAGVTAQRAYAPSVGPTNVAGGSQGAYLLVNTGNGSESITVSGTGNSTVPVYLTHTFTYDYASPKMFYGQVVVDPAQVQNAGVAVFLFIESPKGVYPIALLADTAGEAALESSPRLGNAYLSYFSSPTLSVLQHGSWNYISGISTASTLMPLAYLNGTSVNTLDVPSTIFASSGNYTVGELIEVFPRGDFSVKLFQSDFKFQIFGSVYGLMGTDTNGADVWSEYATSTRIALEIGFGSAVIALVIGTLLGLVAGFFGGLVDSVLIFVFDFLLLIPGLILLIDLDTTFTIAHITPNKVLLLIFILGILGWAGISRIIRSQVLSLRSRTYIQAAQTMGGTKFYILRRHILVHTAGTIIALVTYIVPGLVLADAGLDFLGVGISKIPTWGNILANLVNQITPTNGYLWWINLPIGLSIILLSVGFYLVGTAIQEEYSRAA
jgi:peptide/nickel transport system permease protein